MNYRNIQINIWLGIFHRLWTLWGSELLKVYLSTFQIFFFLPGLTSVPQVPHLMSQNSWTVWEGNTWPPTVRDFLGNKFKYHVRMRLDLLCWFPTLRFLLSQQNLWNDHAPAPSFVVLGIEMRASYMPAKHSYHWAILPVNFGITVVNNVNKHQQYSRCSIPANSI